MEVAYTTYVSISTHIYVHQKQSLEIPRVPYRNLFHVEGIRARTRKGVLAGSRIGFLVNHHRASTDKRLGNGGENERRRKVVKRPSKKQIKLPNCNLKSQWHCPPRRILLPFVKTFLKRNSQYACLSLFYCLKDLFLEDTCLNPQTMYTWVGLSSLFMHTSIWCPREAQ